MYSIYDIKDILMYSNLAIPLATACLVSLWISDHLLYFSFFKIFAFQGLLYIYNMQIAYYYT